VVAIFNPFVGLEAAQEAWFEFHDYVQRTKIVKSYFAPHNPAPMAPSKTLKTRAFIDRI
jgi:hypothetical protein